jgi:hypothetical protein
MTEPAIHRGTGVATVVGALSALYAATFLFGALLHLGVRVPLGFGSSQRRSSRASAGWRCRSPPGPSSPARVGRGRQPSLPTPSRSGASCSARRRSRPAPAPAPI